MTVHADITALVQEEKEKQKMIIVNKDHNDAYNTSHVTNIYIGSDGCSVKVSAVSTTRGGILGKYNSYDDTRKAFEILMREINKAENEVIYMPSDEGLTEKIKAMPKQPVHNITGKKTKGHGGS